MIVENYHRKILQTSYPLLIRAVTSNVPALAALAAHSLVRAVASKMTRLIAVVAQSLVGAVTSDVSRLVAVVAHNVVRAVTSNVAFLVALAANDDSRSLRTNRMGATHYFPPPSITAPRGSHGKCVRAFRSCSR